MKFLTIILTCATFLAYSNKSSFNNDTIEIRDIAIKTSSSGSVQLGDPIQKISKTFGKPLKTSTEYWEMNEKHATIYHYSGATLSFIDNKLESYNITGPEFLVGNGMKGKFFNVNGPLSNIATYLPDWEILKDVNGLNANIVLNGQHIDHFIEISSNPSNETITSIEIRSY